MLNYTIIFKDRALLSYNAGCCFHLLSKFLHNCQNELNVCITKLIWWSLNRFRKSSITTYLVYVSCKNAITCQLRYHVNILNTARMKRQSMWIKIICNILGVYLVRRNVARQGTDVSYHSYQWKVNQKKKDEIVVRKRNILINIQYYNPSKPLNLLKLPGPVLNQRKGIVQM